MDKNTIIAIVVIFFILMIFQIVFLRPKESKESAPVAVEEPAKKEEPGGPSEQKPPKEEKPVTFKTVESGLPGEEGPAVERSVEIETEHYLVTLSTRGAAIVSFRLKDYTDSDGRPVDLVEAGTGDILPFEVFFQRLRQINGGGSNPKLGVFHLVGDNPLEPTFYRDYLDGRGVPFRLEKSFRFSPTEFVFDVAIRIRSLQDGTTLNLDQDNISYTVVWGPTLGPTSVIRNRYNITTQGYYDEGKFHKVLRGAAGCSLRRGEARYEERSLLLDWVSMSNRYFMVGILPEEKNYIYAFDQRGQNEYLLGISHPYFQGTELQDTFRVYAGPKDRKILSSYGHDLESVMSGRILKPIVIFLEFMIRAFYNLTKSWGIAIILMTISIKIILYPLTYKSFQSMRRMSALQPKITEIRERLKSNPQAMNKEVQALYRKEKVNPMGGCLPMILQLPIFYGLYTALSSMIELRNESFLWIRNLSMPDTVATIKTAIPMLGYRVAGQGYTDINILPFVMTATTLLQSRLTSGDRSNQQAKMMTYLFPIMFFFIFWNMPSGLVLYWTIQNILTIGQQYYIDYRMKKKAAAAPVPAPVYGKKKYPKLPAKRTGKKPTRRR
jgi:YidC/Oxa1 family membrane protein insertase